MSNVVPTPKNAALIVASTSVSGMLGSKTTDPEDRATLVTKKVAPTGLAEYAFGSSSWADTGAHVASTKPTSPVTHPAILDITPRRTVAGGVFGRKGTLCVSAWSDGQRPGAGRDLPSPGGPAVPNDDGVVVQRHG